jgi:hypothetical protein
MKSVQMNPHLNARVPGHPSFKAAFAIATLVALSGTKPGLLMFEFYRPTSSVDEGLRWEDVNSAVIPHVY